MFVILVHYIVNLKQKKKLRVIQKKILSQINNKLAKRILIIILLAGLITKLLLNVVPQDLKVHFVDVGQGDCCFITTRIS